MEQFKRILVFAAALSCALAVSACDPIYRSVQPIEVVVTEPMSGRRVEDALVEAVAKPIEEWSADLPEMERFDKWMDRFRQGHGSTNGNGRATIDLEIQTVMGGFIPGIIPGFDPAADRVTGLVYLFRIQKNSARETVTLRMEPGRTRSGDHFTISVISIGDSKRAGEAAER